MKYALVRTNILDLHSKPNFLSERVNQAFYGEPLKITTTSKGWLRVIKSDGYAGWVGGSLVSNISPKQYAILSKSPSGRLIRNSRLYQGPDRSSAEPHLLFYGSPLWIVSSRSGWSRLVSDSERSLYVRSSNIITHRDLSRIKATGAQVVRESQKFLGVPYLWGGISSAGWDCSGMVQTILGRFGISMPRDTKDQLKIGTRIDDSDRRTGDLIHFDRHVGFAIGKHEVIHSSLGGGGVRINSLRPGDDNFRPDLANIYLQTRRGL